MFAGWTNINPAKESIAITAINRIALNPQHIDYKNASWVRKGEGGQMDGRMGGWVDGVFNEFKCNGREHVMPLYGTDC